MSSNKFVDHKNLKIGDKVKVISFKEDSTETPYGVGVVGSIGIIDSLDDNGIPDIIDLKDECVFLKNVNVVYFKNKKQKNWIK